MKRFIRIIVGGKIGVVTWLFAILAIAICYHIIGGAIGLVIGTALAKLSWIPYGIGVIRTACEPTPTP